MGMQVCRALLRWRRRSEVGSQWAGSVGSRVSGQGIVVADGAGAMGVEMLASAKEWMPVGSISVVEEKRYGRARDHSS